MPERRGGMTTIPSAGGISNVTTPTQPILSQNWSFRAKNWPKIAKKN